MNKHTSTHPATGETATRNSKNRTYTHAVWIREPQDERVAAAQRGVESARQYVAKCEAVVADWDAHVAATRAEAVRKYRGFRHLSEAERAEQVEESVHFSTVRSSPLSAWVDNYLPGAVTSLAKAEARLAEILDEGDVAEWGCVTWCGRYDLAQKQAASYAKKGYETLIVEAVLNAPKAATVVEPEPQPEPAEADHADPVSDDEYDNEVQAEADAQQDDLTVRVADDSAATVCGTCGAAWDDTVCTSVTPTPSGRCPWEADHEDERDEDGEPTEGYCDVCGVYADGAGIVNHDGDLLCVLCARDACGVCGSVQWTTLVNGTCERCLHPEQDAIDRVLGLLNDDEPAQADDLREAHEVVLDRAANLRWRLDDVLASLRQAVLDQDDQAAQEHLVLAQAARADLAGLDRLQRRLADALAVALGLPPHP